MGTILLKIAGYTAQVHTLFDSTGDYFRAYRTDAAPDFDLTVSREDLTFEQAELDDEARREGFRPRKFTDPFLERAAIQRGFAEFLFDRNTLLVHGSAVAVDGQGYLFAARSGTGKSTHTRLWREAFGARAVPVNDDKPFLKLHEGGITMYGSPWSGKHGLDTNIAVPLKGICLLERGPENIIRPLAPADVLPMLLHESYCPQDPEKKARFKQLAAQLSRSVPLWRMECTKDPRAALVAYAAMSGNPNPSEVPL